MFTALTLAACVLAAPVPKDAKPAGPAPRMLDLVPDADGKIKVSAIRAEKRKVQRMVQVPKEVKVKVVVNGQEVEETRTVLENVTREEEVGVLTNVRVDLADVRDLKIYTADGKEADKPMALKKLTDGGVVVVADDGQKVDPKYLKLLRDDVLVLVSPELALPLYLQGKGTAMIGVGIGGAPPGAPGLVPRAVPAVVEAAIEDVPILPPGARPALPAPPAPPPLPLPPGEKKADEKKADEKKDEKKKD